MLAAHEHYCQFTFTQGAFVIHYAQVVAKDSQGYRNLSLTHCSLGDFNEIVDEYFSSQLQWLMTEIPAVKLPLEECH